ncbi:DEAD/DEAH box helicase [Xanthomonas campestris pv. campestris]|nr:DEAD/DEAH box helicase [Xanthomonas campestris pv. campestris]
MNNILGEPRVASAISSILELELTKFGARIGVLDPVPQCISDVDFANLAYSIDELGWIGEEGAQEIQAAMAIQLIALTWEHSSLTQRRALRSLCVSVLSRLGVGPSVAMLEDARSPLDEFSALESFASEVMASVRLVENSEIVGSKEYYLTQFQHEILQACSKLRLVGVSAPTSAGKSFALYLLIIKQALASPAPIVYIVPTISLMNQVARDLRNLMDVHQMEGWSIMTTYREFSNNSVYVMTQERALPRIVSTDGLPIGLLVVDEVQNLERFTDDSDVRSKILFDAVTEIYGSSPDTRVVLSGPRVKNLGSLGESIFNVPFDEVESAKSPVASLTYAISEDSLGGILTQYSIFNRVGIARRARSKSAIAGIGKVRYTQEYLGFIDSILEGLGESVRPIIFSPTADQARKTAVGLSGLSAHRSRSAPLSKRVGELAKYVAESVHPSYDLVRCVQSGIGFHTSKVPPHIRLVSEMAYQDGLLHSMVCTTTLMQGVNLPANIVIARNPNLFVDRREGRSQRLSPYEFSNLRGRAGRLMKDFVGRTLVLDGQSFDEGDGDLFPDPEKEVSLTYRDKFEKDRDLICDALAMPGNESDESKFICSQIRQAVLRYGDGAVDRLRGRGVDLDRALIQRVSSQLSEIDVERSVLLENRYWDPFDLQKIKDNFESSSFDALPVSPWKATASQLQELIEFQSAVSPYYFERYLGAVSTPGHLKSLSISAIDWARETPLKDILKDSKHPIGDSAIIDSRVSDIYRKVVYGIPALLKPLSDITNSGQPFLASIESGVYSPVGRMLIEKGLYRDTAVALRRSVMPALDGEADHVARAGLELLLAEMSSLNYWIQRQVQPILGQWKREVNYGKGN